MKRSALFLPLAAACLPLFSTHAAIDLKQSKFTQVVNDVQVIGTDQNATPALVDGVFKVPDILRTGPNSRAELTADDQTITRVGANTVFSFDPANRTIDLQKGSVLFHSPQGRGGGTVQTGSATASVLGTTIVVSTTPDGGFKVLVLEGSAEVKFLNGISQQLNAGQMTFVLPGGGTSPVIVFRLDEQTKGSKLVNGFNHSLDSQGKIDAEIEKQLKLINKDKLKDTGLIVGDKGTSTGVQTVDASVLQNYFTALTEFQPVPAEGGFITIDGLFVQPSESRPSTLNDPGSDGLFAAWALSVPVTIKDAVLNPFHVFVSPNGPFDIVALFNDEVTTFLHNPFQGFFGRYITITTPNIDMTPYAALSYFDFVAAQDINITGSLSFDNASGQNIFLNAILGSINIAPGSTISANANYLGLFSGGSMIFNSVNFNNTGSLDFGTLVDMSITGGSFTAGGFAHFFSQDNNMTISGATISAGSDVYMLSEPSGIGPNPSITITGSTITGNSGVTVFGYGDVNVSSSTIHAPNGNVSFTASSGSLTVNNCDLLGNTGTFNAGGDANLSSLDLSSFTDINISANTVVLTDVNFSGDPNITSKTGTVAPGINTGAQVVRGDINMISGNTYNGTALSEANRNIYINPSEGSGIHTHSMP